MPMYILDRSSGRLIVYSNRLTVVYRSSVSLQPISGHPPNLVDGRLFTVSQLHKPMKFARSSASHLLSIPRHLVLVLFVSLHQKYGIPYTPTSLHSACLRTLLLSLLICYYKSLISHSWHVYTASQPQLAVLSVAVLTLVDYICHICVLLFVAIGHISVLNCRAFCWRKNWKI